MCGRFTLHHTWAEVRAAMSIIPPTEAGRNTAARYNIAPTQDVLFLSGGEDGHRVQQGRWWLVPHWAKELPKYPMFNARSETAHTKSAFRDAFKSKRCLVFSDGYYEWTKAEDGGKDPHHIHLPDHEPYAYAGLWAHNSKLDVTSCTILTAEADPSIAHIHDRMPIILEPGAFEEWLDARTGVDDAREVLKRHRGSELLAYRVNRQVNSNRNQGAGLLEACG